MPRVSGAYKLGDRTVVKGGYGLYFDTLNAGDYTGFNQLGYSVDDDQRRQHRLRPDLAARGSEERRLADHRSVPGAPQRQPVRGAHRQLARRRHDSRHRLHARESQPQAPAGAALARRRPARAVRATLPSKSPTAACMRIASAGTSRRSTCRRSTTATSPTSATQASSRCCSSRCRIRSTSATSPRWRRPTRCSTSAWPATPSSPPPQCSGRRCCAAFPQLSGLTYANLPLGKVKSHALEITVNRRYSSGLSANLAFAATRVTENRTVETYDREPTLWQTSQAGRPWRISGGAVYEFPFGDRKPFLNNGGVLAKIYRRLADRRHGRIPARGAARLGQRGVQRRLRRHQQGQS